MRFEFFEHTGDVKFRAYGKDLPERFANAALAVSSIVLPSQEVKAKTQRSLDLKAKDPQGLLYTFIDEIIYLIDAEFFLINNIKDITITKNSEYALRATLVGDVNDGSYQTHGGVKAATYNEMDITDEYIQMVVDI